MPTTTNENRRLADLLEALPCTRILVVGDLILDRYADGKASRVSPEAPVLVFEYENDRYLLGGACNVAANLRELGAATSVLGVVGNDGVWNNIKTFHRATYPDRLVATDLGVQRYDRVVAGLGGHGEFVERAALLRPALERARASGRAALVNVHIAETARASSNYQQ